MKDKIIKLSELGVEQIEELIKLAEEINNDLPYEPIYGSIRDDQILKEVQTVLQLTKEIRKSIVLHRSVDVDKHRSLIVAKLRLTQLV